MKAIAAIILAAAITAPVAAQAAEKSDFYKVNASYAQAAICKKIALKNKEYGKAELFKKVMSRSLYLDEFDPDTAVSFMKGVFSKTTASDCDQFIKINKDKF